MVLASASILSGSTLRTLSGSERLPVFQRVMALPSTCSVEQRYASDVLSPLHEAVASSGSQQNDKVPAC